MKGGDLIFLGLDKQHPGLKSVLENNKILKIIHDCRNDWDSLLYQYSVRLYSFIDTQEAYYVYHLFIHQELKKSAVFITGKELMKKAVMLKHDR